MFINNFIMFLFSAFIGSFLGILCGILNQIKYIKAKKNYNFSTKELIILISNILTLRYIKEIFKPYSEIRTLKIVEREIEKLKNIK